MGSRISCTVTDTGSGIAREHLPHIFDRFYKVDLARTAGGGTGLGLAVVKSLVELMGGEVSVTSKPGHGSKFQILLSSAREPNLPEEP